MNARDRKRRQQQREQCRTPAQHALNSLRLQIERPVIAIAKLKVNPWDDWELARQPTCTQLFCIADVKHAPGVPLHMNWIMHGAFQKVRTWVRSSWVRSSWVRSSIVQLRDPLDVVA